MNKNASNPPQSSLILRVLGGGYLVYLAWDLRGSIQDSPLFLIAVIVFALIGLILLVHSVMALIRNGSFRKDPIPEIESTEDCEEQSDE